MADAITFQQPHIWQSLLSGCGGASPAVTGGLEQLLAHGATASFIQAAALASSVAAADHFSQGRAPSVPAIPAPTTSVASGFSDVSMGGDESNVVEQVSSYTVEEPSSDSSSGSKTVIEDAELDFLCELLSSDQSSDDGMRADTPPALSQWNGDNSQWTPTMSVPRGVASPTAVPATSPTSGAGLAAQNSLWSPGQIDLQDFLSLYDELAPDPSASSLSLSSSSLSTTSLNSLTTSRDHSASIDDILSASQPSPSSVTSTEGDTSNSSQSTTTTSTANQPDVAPKQGLLAPKLPSRSSKRSPRLSAARRTVSAPAYTVTLPDTDESEPSNSSSGSNEGIDEAGDVKRRRGSRGKKRAKSDSVGGTTHSYDKDSHRYRRRRDQNNEAVRRCRQKTREKFEESVRQTATLQAENAVLKDKLASMEKDMTVLRHSLSAARLSSSSSPPPPLRRQRGIANAGQLSSSSSSSEEDVRIMRNLTTTPASLWDMFMSG